MMLLLVEMHHSFLPDIKACAILSHEVLSFLVSYPGFSLYTGQRLIIVPNFNNKEKLPTELLRELPVIEKDLQTAIKRIARRLF